MTAEEAISWANTRVGNFLNKDLREYAVTDFGTYPGSATTDPTARAKVQSNYDKWGKNNSSIKSGECNGFAELVYGRLVNPSFPNDPRSPSVQLVGLMRAGVSGYGHNIVLLNRRNDDQRKISLDPLPLDANLWVIVDGWYAALGHQLDRCIRKVDDELLSWGNEMQIHKGWNPNIPVLRGQTTLKRKTGHNLW